MPTSYTNLLGFALPVTGELSGTWGDVVNNSITELVEDSIAGSATASVASGDWTLTTTGSGSTNQARCAILIPTGSPGVTRNIIAPASSKAYIVDNQSNAAVVVKASATTGVTIAAGDTVLVAWDGSDFVQVGKNGTVTSVGGTGTVNGITLTGTVTSSGNLTLGGTLSGVSLSTQVTGTLPVGNGGTGATTLTGVVKGNGTSAFTAGSVNLASEVTGTLPIANGGTGATSAPNARTNLGATTVGSNLFTLTNPSAITFPRLNADNSVSALSASDFRTAIGAGTVTSVGGTGSVNGITLTGTVTSSGDLTLGGTLSNVSLTTQITGTLPVGNGGTGATTLTANNVILGNGTSAVQFVAPGPSGNVLKSNGTTWTSAAEEAQVYPGAGIAVSTGSAWTTSKTSPSGDIVGTTDTQTLSAKRINPRVVAASATSGNLTINGDTTDVYKAEGLTGAITFLQPSGTPVDGQRLMIRIEDNGTARAITWTTSAGAFRAVGITLPTTTVLSKVTYVGCIYNATDSFWDAVATVTQA